MNCHPSPETTCGTLLNDSCVVITGSYVFPCTYPSTTKSGCYRQSEFNEYVGPKICDFEHRIGEIESSINLTTLSGGTCLTADKTSVHASLQQLLTKVCALETNLDLPINDLNIACLTDPCGIPISTLGQLLSVLATSVCDSSANPEIYRAVLTQAGGAAPTVTVLENTVGLIVWTRSAAGVYIGTLASAFTANKTFLLMGTVGTSTPTFVRTSTSVVTISTDATDGSLTETAVEIRVYP